MYISRVIRFLCELIHAYIYLLYTRTHRQEENLEGESTETKREEKERGWRVGEMESKVYVIVSYVCICGTSNHAHRHERRTHTSWYARKGFLGFLRERRGVVLGGGSAGKAGWLSHLALSSSFFSLTLPRSCAQHFNRFHLRACEWARGLHAGV